MRTRRFGAVIPAVLFALAWLSPAAFAQVRGGGLTIHVAGISPLIALIAGILILLVPRLLNFIVAIYLIIVGVIGLFVR